MIARKLSGKLLDFEYVAHENQDPDDVQRRWTYATLVPTPRGTSACSVELSTPRAAQGVFTYRGVYLHLPYEYNAERALEFGRDGGFAAHSVCELLGITPCYPKALTMLGSTVLAAYDALLAEPDVWLADSHMQFWKTSRHEITGMPFQRSDAFWKVLVTLHRDLLEEHPPVPKYARCAHCAGRGAIEVKS